MSLDIIGIFVNCIFWQISNETIENQDLYIDRDYF